MIFEISATEGESLFNISPAGFSRRESNLARRPHPHFSLSHTSNFKACTSHENKFTPPEKVARENAKRRASPNSRPNEVEIAPRPTCSTWD